MDSNTNPEELVYLLIDQFKQNQDLNIEHRENIAKSMATSMAIKRGVSLDEEEMQSLIDQLFACALPFKSPGGRNCFISFDFNDLNKRFVDS